jgi:DnaJ-class molecular chaperone
VGCNMNFYTILGIPRNADDETIRSAYRILARRFHPDRGTGSSVEKFRQVNEAYETLIDSRSRHSYDLSLGWTEAQGPVPINAMMVPSGFFRQEDPSVFGRFSPVLKPSVRGSTRSDELFGLFFDSEWPW